MSDETMNEIEERAHKTRATDRVPGCRDCAILNRRFDDHLLDYREYKRDENQKWDTFVEVQHRNTESLDRLVESTNGLVEAWKAGSGVIKVINWSGKVVKWVGGIALAATAVLAWLTHK